MSRRLVDKWDIVICLIGLTAVIPTLWGRFIFDDGEAILNNSDVTGEDSNSTVFQVFYNDFWGRSIKSRHSHKSYRPLTTLSFRLDYFLWGQNPFPFHFVSWIIHGLNCLLVHKLLRASLRYCSRGKGPNDLPFWGSIIFAVHPVHVEPLGGLVGRADLLGSLVFLSGFLAALRVPKTYSNVSSGLILGFISVLGALFKENASVLPLTFAAFDLLIRRRLKLTKSAFLRYFLAHITVGAFVFWRLWFQNGPPIFQPHDNPSAFAPNFFSRASTTIYLWALNVYILLNPIWLCYDWSMGCIPLIQEYTDPRLLVVALFVVLLARSAQIAIKNRILGFTLLFAGSTFLPASNLLFTVGFVLAERNLYLPSIGWSTLVAYTALKLRQKRLLALLAVILLGKSIHRSIQWTDSSLLFHSAFDVCPNNAKIHYNLGTLYGDAGDVGKAKNYYRAAISLKGDYFQSMNNLANLLRTEGNLEEAEIWLRKALSIKPDFAASWMNLGIVLSRKNQTEARGAYFKALEHRRIYPDCLFNLGNLFMEMGERESALKAWKKATQQSPKHTQSWTNLIIALEQDGKLDEAEETGARALEIIGNGDEMLHFLMGGVLGKMGSFSRAEEHLLKAVELVKNKGVPIPVKFYTNLGVLYHRWYSKSSKEEHLNLARRYYESALRIDPGFEPVKKNLGLLPKKKS